MRRSGGTTSDIISVFAISTDGGVYLNGNKQKPILTLNGEFKRVIVTLDIINATTTAYAENGEVIATDTLQIPLSSEEDQTNYGKFKSFEEWYMNTGALYQWYFSSGGGDLAYDNLKIYTGEYVAP